MLANAISDTLFARLEGHCPICENDVIFSAAHPWFRDHLICPQCPGGSIPRERATMVMIKRLVPRWRDLSIHESSPCGRGLSVVLKRECPKYIDTQFFDGMCGGSTRKGVRCENLELQTFPDSYFDLVLTQDVMEHLFNPDVAYREIARTLKPGGLHIHTTPIYRELAKSVRKAARNAGKIIFFGDPEYHGNPVGDGRSLVTWNYGQDLPELIRQWAPFAVEVTQFDDPHYGLVAEFLDVIVCRKL